MEDCCICYRTNEEIIETTLEEKNKCMTPNCSAEICSECFEELTID